MVDERQEILHLIRYFFTEAITAPAQDGSMNEENPYAVSPECMGKAEVAIDSNDPHAFQVVGDLVVCGKHVILPPICPLTGATEDLVSVSRTVNYAVLSVVIAHRSCEVTHSISRRKRNQQQFRMAGCVLLFAVGVVCLLSGNNLVFRDVMINLQLGIVAVFVAITGLRLIGKGLKVVRYEAPNTYWVAGFPKLYLTRLADHGALTASAGALTAAGVATKERDSKD